MTALAPVPRGLLDSDVIFSRVLHELLGRVAREGRLLDLIWSEELLAEAERALQERKGLDAEVARRWVGYLRGAFPDGEVDPTELPASLDLSGLTTDPDDEFICALAIAGDAQLLFTFDRGYLATGLREHGIEVVSPDAWLSAAMDDEPALFGELIRRQAAVWGGGRPVPDLLDAFERAGAPAFAARARELLGA